MCNSIDIYCTNRSFINCSVLGPTRKYGCTREACVQHFPVETSALSSTAGSLHNIEFRLTTADG